MKRNDYFVKLTPSEEGGFVVTCRDLPELITQGDDVSHALSEARDARDEVLAAYAAGGIEPPAPTPPERGEYVI